jgi:hypothetical protein
MHSTPLIHEYGFGHLIDGFKCQGTVSVDRYTRDLDRESGQHHIAILGLGIAPDRIQQMLQY